MVTERLVQVDVVTGQRRSQARTQFLGEHLVTQTLRLTDFAVVHRQRNMVTAGTCRLEGAANVEHGALPSMECREFEVVA